MRGEQDGRKVLWMGKVLPLFRPRTSGKWDIEELEYFQFMEAKKAISGLDRALGCVFVLGATRNELDKNFDTERFTREESNKAGEY